MESVAKARKFAVSKGKRQTTRFEFDKNGNWDKVDCHHAAVPAAIIPASIANYVKANFPDS